MALGRYRSNGATAMNRQQVFQRKRMVRTALLERARDLARSGEHSNADGIVAAMQHAHDCEDARCWFDNWSFRHQLDRLCALAQQRK